VRFDSHSIFFSSLLQINLGGRTVILGLNDSHLHVIREGLHFNLEVQWDGVRSLKAGLEMIRQQAARTPEGQWVRVVGGWCEHQFREKRLPALAELDEAGGNRPVFVLHLYDCALVNRLGLALLGYKKDTPNPPSGEIVRDADGHPTGLLIARPNAFLLYNTLNRLPKLTFEQQKNSTLAYQRELHRFGLTSAMDPGGGFQNYPNDDGVVQKLDQANLLTRRIAFSLFPQKAGHELEDFKAWSKIVKPGDGSPFLRQLGAGEMLAFSAWTFSGQPFQLTCRKFLHHEY
jgi:predicted amidohydrolase YtcJ